VPATSGVTHAASLVAVHWQFPVTVTLAENEPPLMPTGWALPPDVVDEVVALISPAVQAAGGVGEAGDGGESSPQLVPMPATSTTIETSAPARQRMLTSGYTWRAVLLSHLGLPVAYCQSAGTIDGHQAAGLGRSKR
jgi:hypothetical protein